MSDNIKIEEADIESIAKLIFSNNSTQIGQYQLFPPEKDPELMFEILLTLFMNGIMLFTNNLNDIDIANIDINILHDKMCELDKYFLNISYDLFITKINKNELNNNHFCKILCKNIDNTYFAMKKIDKPYTFIINGDIAISLSSLEDYKSIFIINNVAFEIWFSKIT